MAVADLFDLTGRTALVTGASSGLGHRFGLVLARQGANVVLTARRADRLEELKTEIEAIDGSAHAVAMDVTNAGDIADAFDAAEAAFGPVDILINNAGMAVQTPATDMSEDEWRTIMGTNVDGVWNATREMARRLIAAEMPGSVVNIASIAAIRALPTLSAYCVTKAAVAHMTHALAVEFARHKIRVNAIAPGYFRTEINQHFLDSPAAEAFLRQVPQRRYAMPEEMDATLLLLASEKASPFMTGSVVVVDGGQSL